jgi:integrase
MAVGWLLAVPIERSHQTLPRLTKRVVEAVTPGDKDIYVRDSEVRGFALKVTPTGTRVYVQSYRFNGRRGWLTHGRHGDITAEEARKLALAARSRIAAGEDPRRSKAAELTVSELGARFIVEYAEPFKKPRSVEEDRRNFNKHVVPAIGDLPLSAVARQDILRLQHRMRATPGAANRVLALVSKMFSWTEEVGLRPPGSNPCRRIRKFKENRRERFLSADELRRLGNVLAEAARVGDHRAEVNIIRLLLLTGARLDEIAGLRWGYIDFENGYARLPDSKSGAKTIRLGAPALDLLATLPRLPDQDLVFPDSRGRPQYRSRIERAWWRFRTAAALESVKLHDLRHTHGSWAALGGASLPMVGALLGHRQAATTMRYIHLRDDPVHQVAETVSAALSAAMTGAPAEVTPLSRARNRK